MAILLDRKSSAYHSCQILLSRSATCEIISFWISCPLSTKTTGFSLPNLYKTRTKKKRGVQRLPDTSCTWPGCWLETGGFRWQWMPPCAGSDCPCSRQLQSDYQRRGLSLAPSERVFALKSNHIELVYKALVVGTRVRIWRLVVLFCICAADRK